MENAENGEYGEFRIEHRICCSGRIAYSGTEQRVMYSHLIAFGGVASQLAHASNLITIP